MNRLGLANSPVCSGGTGSWGPSATNVVIDTLTEFQNALMKHPAPTQNCHPTVPACNLFLFDRNRRESLALPSESNPLSTQVFGHLLGTALTPQQIQVDPDRAGQPDPVQSLTKQ